jgi:hypothetical protein
LYSKSDAPPSARELKVSPSIRRRWSSGVRKQTNNGQPYYSKLIDEYFPNPVIRW